MSLDDVHREAMADHAIWEADNPPEPPETSNETQWREDDDADSYEDDDNEPCSWCGGEGFDECDDPIQCTTPGCDGEMCECKACDGRGHSQTVW